MHPQSDIYARSANVLRWSHLSVAACAKAVESSLATMARSRAVLRRATAALERSSRRREQYALSVAKRADALTGGARKACRKPDARAGAVRRGAARGGGDGG
jgi:hypothetical protein